MNAVNLQLAQFLLLGYSGSETYYAEKLAKLTSDPVSREAAKQTGKFLLVSGSSAAAGTILGASMAPFFAGPAAALQQFPAQPGQKLDARPPVHLPEEEYQTIRRGVERDPVIGRLWAEACETRDYRKVGFALAMARGEIKIPSVFQPLPGQELSFWVGDVPPADEEQKPDSEETPSVTTAPPDFGVDEIRMAEGTPPIPVPDESDEPDSEETALLKKLIDQAASREPYAEQAFFYEVATNPLSDALPTLKRLAIENPKTYLPLLIRAWEQGLYSDAPQFVADLSKTMQMEVAHVLATTKTVINMDDFREMTRQLFFMATNDVQYMQRLLDIYHRHPVALEVLETIDLSNLFKPDSYLRLNVAVLQTISLITRRNDVLKAMKEFDTKKLIQKALLDPEGYRNSLIRLAMAGNIEAIRGLQTIAITEIDNGEIETLSELVIALHYTGDDEAAKTMIEVLNDLAGRSLSLYPSLVRALETKHEETHIPIYPNDWHAIHYGWVNADLSTPNDNDLSPQAKGFLEYAAAQGNLSARRILDR